MARPTHVDFPLPVPTMGLERRTKYATLKHASEALDVIEDTGDLRRRDAYKSIAVADPFYFAAGHTLVASDYEAGAADDADRNPTITGLNILYVGVGGFGVAGAREKFSGFSIGLLDNSGASFSESLRMVVDYYNGTSWVPVPWFFTDTWYIDSNGHRQPLSKDGVVAWHIDDLTNWATIDPTGASTGYFVRVTFEDLSGTAAQLAGTITMAAPGIRAFKLAPVNGLFPVKVANRDSLVIGADRRDQEGVELGASLGIVDQNGSQTKRVYSVVEEVPCTYGNFTWPNWFRDAVDLGTGGASGYTANALRKTIAEFWDNVLKAVRSFAWQGDNTGTNDPSGQFRGGILARNKQLSSLTTISGVGSGSDFSEKNLEGCRLFVRTGGGGATALDVREIAFHDKDNDALYWYEAFGSAPNSSARFDILGPPFKVICDPEGYIFEIDGNSADVITLIAQPFARDDDTTVLASWNGMIRVVQDPRYDLAGGHRYTGFVDPVTGLLIIANGSSLLELDGRCGRRLKAEYQSDIALSYVGALADVETKDTETDPVAYARSQLRVEPPRGKYIVTHQARIFVAGLPGKPFHVQWSAPGGYNNLWPVGYESMVRDQEQNPITGMATLRDRLMIFTATDIHEAYGPNDQGYFFFRPITQGVGFVHHNAVAKVVAGEATILAGVSQDGIYAVTEAGQAKQVLEDWEQLFPGGVSQSALKNAVAVAWPEENWMLFAVTPAGHTKNDRIVVWDYKSNSWWVWTAPWGVSAMAIDRASSASARLLIGTDDGFVQTLTSQEEDDGQTVTGYVQSQSIEPKQGVDVVPVRGILTVKNMGSQKTADFSLYYNDKRELELTSAEVVADQDGLTWNQRNWHDDAPSEDMQRWWMGADFLAVEVGIPSGVRMNSVAYRMSGSSRWALRTASLVITAKRKRGQR